MNNIYTCSFGVIMTSLVFIYLVSLINLTFHVLFVVSYNEVLNLLLLYQGLSLVNDMVQYLKLIVTKKTKKEIIPFTNVLD